MDDAKMQKYLKDIEKYWLEHGYPATRRELMVLWGLASTCPVQRRLARLEQAGLLRCDNGKMLPVQMLKRVQEVMGC